MPSVESNGFASHMPALRTKHLKPRFYDVLEIFRPFYADSVGFIAKKYGFRRFYYDSQRFSSALLPYYSLFSYQRTHYDSRVATLLYKLFKKHAYDYTNCIVRPFAMSMPTQPHCHGSGH